MRQPRGGDVLDPSIPEAWLNAYPSGVMIEYTSRCNLRCKYCTKSNPGDDDIPGRDQDMDKQTLDSVMAFLAKNRFREIMLAGTGESTFHPRWTEDFPRLIAAGRAANPQCFVHLNSNFAQKYEDEHWAILAQLDGIVISIDTADRKITREVRAKSDLGLIIYNIARFKAYCEERGLRFPRISINVTLFQDAAAGLSELMTLLAPLGIAYVSLSDMVETEGAKLHGIRAVNTDNRVAFAKAVADIQRAITKAQTLGKFALYVQPHLMERINKLIGEVNEDVRTPVAVEPAAAAAGKAPLVFYATRPGMKPGTTKMCMQPWTRFTLAADASMYPCCVTDMPPVGSLSAGADPMLDGVNGDRIRRFRHELLVGKVPTVCVACSNAATTSVAQLQQSVKALVDSHVPQVTAA
jgi:molybdenum cofactor biosynthesis enzyme MoaA